MNVSAGKKVLILIGLFVVLPAVVAWFVYGSAAATHVLQSRDAGGWPG